MPRQAWSAKRERQYEHIKKSAQKSEDEKFFGAATAHLYFVKNAWRNHVAHTRDSYSDGEALKVMQRTADFVESLCGRLSEDGAVKTATAVQ